jgi:hypothetical protein
VWTIKRRPECDQEGVPTPFAWHFAVYLVADTRWGEPLVNAVRLQAAKADWPEPATAAAARALLKTAVEDEILRRHGYGA